MNINDFEILARQGKLIFSKKSEIILKIYE